MQESIIVQTKVRSRHSLLVKYVPGIDKWNWYFFSDCLGLNLFTHLVTTLDCNNAEFSLFVLLKGCFKVYIILGAGETGGNPDEEGADKDKALQMVPDHIWNFKKRSKTSPSRKAPISEMKRHKCPDPWIERWIQDSKVWKQLSSCLPSGNLWSLLWRGASFRLDAQRCTSRPL